MKTMACSVSPCRPSFGQVGRVGPSTSQQMKPIWRLAWGEGTGLKPMAWVPSFPPGQGLGKPLLRPLGASVLQVW